jgi:hypothetical protein
LEDNKREEAEIMGNDSRVTCILVELHFGIMTRMTIIIITMEGIHHSKVDVNRLYIKK